MSYQALSRISKRFFSETRKEEIGSYTLSRGVVGRKVFTKGWKHLQPRYPINLQERWHRAAIERLFHPSMIENITNTENGERDTLDYRMFFFDKSIQVNENERNENDINRVSPWHDIPLGFKSGTDGNLYFNYINEIPRLDRAKMECCLSEQWNPIKQDVKKGKLRYFNYGDIPFNYGFISQTWEDPGVESAYSDVKGLMGDGDPIDVVELSPESLSRGSVTPIKVLAVLGLIDEGETDWKIIGLNANHPDCGRINSMSDANSVLGTDFSGIILDWFRNYKVPDGKPQNSFSHGEVYQGSDVAIEVIEECHRHWLDLMLGGISGERVEDKVDLTSVTQKHLIAQGLTSKSKIGDLPKVEYPRYDDWQARPGRRMTDVDSGRDEFELDEEAPDQRKI